MKIRVLLAFCAWWMSFTWCWVLYLEVRYGYAIMIVEPRLAFLYAECAMTVFVSLFSIGYIVVSLYRMGRAKHG